MSKRKVLKVLSCTDGRGERFDVKVYLNPRPSYRLSARVQYGELSLLAHRFTEKKAMMDLVRKVCSSAKHVMVNRPFYQEGQYIYLLGQRKKLTQDVRKKDDPEYFYYSKTAKTPLTRYRSMFLSYLRERLVEIGKEYDLDLSQYCLGVGFFGSYFGCCFPTKKKFKFDLRTFAFRKEILDSLLYHEVTHLVAKGHDKRFYRILNLHDPDYATQNAFLKNGYFEGEKDEENYR